jgi:hypothetical protein
MEMAAEFGIGQHVVQNMFEGSWVPRLLTEDNKLQQKHVFSQLLASMLLTATTFFTAS